MLLSTSNPTPSSQVTVKKSGENMLFPATTATGTNNNSNNSNNMNTKEQRIGQISSSLSPFVLQPITTTPYPPSKSSMEALSSSSSYPQQQHELKASSETSIIPPPRLQPPTTTNFPIITSSNPSIRSATTTTTTGHPTFHSSFPIMTNNFLAPPLFSSKIHSTSIPTISTLPSPSVSPNSLISSINNTPTKSNVDNVPKPVPTASSILAPSLSLIETDSISPQPVRVSTILSSFNNSDPSKSANSSSNSQSDTISTTTPKITRVRKLTPRRGPEQSQEQTKQVSEPTTPTKEQVTRNEASSESNPFTTLYSKPLSSFPLHHPSSSVSGSGNFSPFPPPSNTPSHSRLVSPSTPSPSPISLWPSTTTTTKQVVPPPPLPLNVSPPSTKKRRVNSQDSIGASLQPLTPVTPPTPSAQFPFPSVRLPPNGPPPGLVPPLFPIPPVSLISLKPSTLVGPPPERKVIPPPPPTITDTKSSKKKENLVGCNSIRIPFKSWMKTLDTLSSPSLRAVQERVIQLLEKKEEEKRKNLLAKQQQQESSIVPPSTKLSCSNETLSLLSTDLSSIDTLAILALADSPPSPNMVKSSEMISESVELFSKSPDKSMVIESDDSEEESEEEIDVNLKIAKVEPFVREYSGNGFIYPGRRGAKSQRVRLPICFYPSMRSVLVAESGNETFIEGFDSINPVIDLEHHLEFFISDSDRKLYNSIKGLHLMLLKRISKSCCIEESSVLVQRSSRSDDGGYNFSIVNQSSLNPPVVGQRQADYSLLLVEPRGKRKNATQDFDKVNRYCEIIHEQGNQCKIRVGFRICKAQKKKHTKGVYMLRLVAVLSDDPEVKFDSSHQPINGAMKVLEESELFKIVSRRVTAATNKPTTALKRKADDEEADSYSE